jgi:hypothetical protein
MNNKSDVAPTHKPEAVRDPVPMPAAAVRQIRMIQYASNAIPPECTAEITSGCIEVKSGTHDEK